MVSTTVDTSRWRLSSLHSNKELRGPSPRRNSISFCRFLILSIYTRWLCKVWSRLVIVYNENIKTFTSDRCLEREIKRFSLDLFKRKSKYFFWGKDVDTGWGHEKGFFVVREWGLAIFLRILVLWKLPPPFRKKKNPRRSFQKISFSWRCWPERYLKQSFLLTLGHPSNPFFQAIHFLIRQNSYQKLRPRQTNNNVDVFPL